MMLWRLNVIGVGRERVRDGDVVGQATEVEGIVGTRASREGVLRRAGELVVGFVRHGVLGVVVAMAWGR